MPTARYAFATSQTEVGLAIETTRGTAVAPKFWVPTKAPKYKPNLTMIDDDTLQGSMVQVYDQVRGLRYDSHGWDSFPYLDSFPLFVRAELGSTDSMTAAPTSTTLSAAAVAGATTVTVAAPPAAGSYIVIGTGGTTETAFVASVATDVLTLKSPLVFAHASGATVKGLTKHAFSLLNNSTLDGHPTGNQPPSVTITDFDGGMWRQLTAAQIDELTIKGNATGFVTYTCTWFANAATTPSAPSPSWSGSQAVPGWTAYAMIGGSHVAALEDWQFDFKRGVKPIPALTGTQEYFMYFAGPLQATGKLTILEQATSPLLAQYLNGTNEALDLTFFDLHSGYACNVHSSKAGFKAADVDRSQEEVRVTLTVQLLPTATDATAGGVSPVEITVANGQATSF